MKNKANNNEKIRKCLNETEETGKFQKDTISGGIKITQRVNRGKIIGKLRKKERKVYKTESKNFENIKGRLKKDIE